jgi:hypothetical protein
MVENMALYFNYASSFSGECGLVDVAFTDNLTVASVLASRTNNEPKRAWCCHEIHVGKQLSGRSLPETGLPLIRRMT